MSLPTDAKERKQIPIFSGFIKYFPLAIAAVATHSFKSNEQHNPGEPLHWDRSKSTDEKDALARHLTEEGMTEDLDEEVELATAVAWRSMADLQKLKEKQIENSNSKKLAREDGVGSMISTWRRGEALEKEYIKRLNEGAEETGPEQYMRYGQYGRDY